MLLQQYNYQFMLGLLVTYVISLSLITDMISSGMTEEKYGEKK
jgi:hypothetical protein